MKSKRLLLALMAVFAIGSTLEMFPRGGGGGGGFRGGGGGGGHMSGARSGGMARGGGARGGSARSGAARSGAARSGAARTGARSGQASRGGNRGQGNRGQGNRGQGNRGQGNRGNRGNRNVHNHVNNFYGGGWGYGGWGWGGLGFGLGFGLLLSAPYWGWGYPGWGYWPAPTSTTVVVQSDGVFDNPQYGEVECWNDSVNGVPVRRCYVPNEGYFVWDEANQQYWDNNRSSWVSQPYIYPAVGTVDDYRRDEDSQ